MFISSTESTVSDFLAKKYMLLAKGNNKKGLIPDFLLSQI